MILLSIEAAASPPSVALSLDGTVFEQVCDESRPQAEHLLALVEALLAEHATTLAELDGMAVGRGPGSFTGLRVAAATAQGLAYSSDNKLASVSSLHALAHEAFHDANEGAQALAEGPLLVCLDARKSQVYCALYEVNELGLPEPVSPERVIDPEEVVAQFKGVAKQGVGSGFAQYPKLAELEIPVLESHPSARAVAVRANSGAVSFEAPYRALPQYVRDNVTHGT